MSSYEGGKRTRAVKRDFDGLAGIYMSGKKDAENTREIVRKERRELQEELASSFKEMKMSGITDFDNGTYQLGQNLREITRQTIQQNQSGAITRNQANAIITAQIGQANRYINSTDVMAKKFEDIQKRVADGELSPLTYDLAATNWFSHNADGQAIFTDPITGQQRPAARMLGYDYMPDGRGGYQHVVVQEQEFENENGDIQMSRTIKPMDAVVNRDFTPIANVSVDSKVEEIRKQISNTRKFAVDGTEIDLMNLITVATGPAGDKTMTYQYAPETFPDIQRYVLNRVNSMSDNEMAAILGNLGGGLVDGGHYQIRRLDEVNAQYSGMPSVEMIAGDGKYNDIKFERDPLAMYLAESNGEILLNEDNRNLARSLVMQGLYKSFDVDYEAIRTGRMPVSRNSTQKKLDTVPAEMTYTSVTGQNGGIAQVTRIDKDWVKSTVGREVITQKFISGDVSGSKYVTYEDNYLNNGQYTVTTDDKDQPMSLTPAAVQTFYDKNEEMHGGSFNNLDKVYTSFKNQTTFSNNELLDANGIVGAKQTDGSYKIMITGNIEGANTEIAVKSGGGTQSGNTGQSMGVTKESKIGALSMPLSNEEAGKLYQALYKNNSTFQAWANKYIPEGSNKAIGPQPYKHTLPKTSKYASTRTVHTEYYIYEFLKTLENN